MPLIDLRSDTVSKPSPEMRKAMAEAEVGDEQYGDDPTVNHLQEMAADMFGMEAALFVPSGRMGNLVSILTHTRPGEEIIVSEKAHIYHAEAGGVSVFAGVSLFTVPNEADGSIRTDHIEAAIRPPNDPNRPRTRLLCLENSHERLNGFPLPPSSIAKMTSIARDNDLSVHVDGARIFNTAVALDCPPKTLVESVDSITFCLSKGLACPVGSIVCGNADFIHEADRWRRYLGGGMRQIGFVAAAGVIALQSMVNRMAEDHTNAKKLASGLSEIPKLSLDTESVRTNIVRFQVSGGATEQVVEYLRNVGILINHAPIDLRMVTHYGVDEADIEYTISETRKAVSALVTSK